MKYKTLRKKLKAYGYKDKIVEEIISWYTK